jgi:hypothetical protein
MIEFFLSNGQIKGLVKACSQKKQKITISVQYPHQGQG